MSVHNSVAMTMLDRMMATPDGMKSLYSTQKGLREGRWSKEYTNSIGQHGVRSPGYWPLEQVAAFATVHSMITLGDVAMVPVSTNGPPHADADREANAAALRDLPHPFTAEVDMDQNAGDQDGQVHWSEPIEVTIATRLTEPLPGGGVYPLPLHCMIPPGSASLEIGSSLPSRTWMHLILEGGAVARWPYGHSQFRLFVNLAWADEIREWADSLKASSSLQPEDKTAVRTACAALGHPRTIRYPDIVKYGTPKAGTAEQAALW